MAKKNIPNLSEGFEEVPLSEGFEEVPLSQPFPAEKSTLESIGETASDVGRGVLSGLTLGGLEELTAGAKALASDEKDDFSTLYKKYLEVEEQKEKAAKERSPTASLVGEIGGSLLPAFATGGIGLAASGGRAAAQLGGKELLKAAGKAALAEGALGTVGGAVAGGLSSEGGLIGATEEEKEKLLEDVKSGALTGGVFGAALGAGGPLVKAGAEKFKKSGQELLESTLLGKEITRSFKEGIEGKGYITEASRTLRKQEEATGVANIEKFLLNLEEKAAEEFKEPLKVAGDLGYKLNLNIENADDFISGLKKAGAKSELVEKMKGILKPEFDSLSQTYVKKSLDPLEAYNLRKELMDEIDQNPDLVGYGTALKEQIDKNIEELFKTPKLKQFLEKNKLPTSFKEGIDTYKDVVKSSIESLTEKGKPATLDVVEGVASPLQKGARRNRFRDLAAPESTLFTAIQDVVGHLKLPGTTADTALSAMYSKEGGFKPLLEDLIKKRPEELKRIALKMGFEDPEKLKNYLVKSIEDLSEKASVRRIVEGERPMGSGVPTFGGLSQMLTRKPLVAGANILGQAETVVKKGVAEVSKKQPIAAIKSIYKLPETALRKMATSMESRPAFKQYATQLGQAIDAGDSVKKEAILFALMQRPDFRQMVPSMTGMGEEENEQ
jgi:hypothetical protein